MTHGRQLATGLLGSLLCCGAWAAAAAANVFFSVSVDPQPLYVQGAVSLKVQVFSGQKLYQASVELADNADVLVQRIGKDVSSQETRDGRNYQVITRHYALLPQRSGDLLLDGPVLDAEVADGTGDADPILSGLFSQLQISGGFGATQPLRVHGDAIRLRVQARPADTGSSPWLPAQQLTLDAAWPAVGTPIAAGQPVTRRLRLTAVGLSANQLPDLSSSMPLPPGLKAYPGEPKLVDEMQDSRIVGRREQDIALLADHAGRFELPELRLSWWDAVNHQRREAVLAAHTMEVAPGTSGAPIVGADRAAALTAATRAASAAPSARGASPASMSSATLAGAIVTQTQTWVWASLTLGLLLAGTLGGRAWARQRHRSRGRAGPPARASKTRALSAAAARRAFRRACRSNASLRARAALIAWACSTRPQEPPAGLNALARRLGRTSVTPLLRDLDRACLCGTAWSGEALARALPTLAGEIDGQPMEANRALPQLYSERHASAGVTAQPPGIGWGVKQ